MGTAADFQSRLTSSSKLAFSSDCQFGGIIQTGAVFAIVSEVFVRCPGWFVTYPAVSASETWGTHF
jgi:hypothetical protein